MRNSYLLPIFTIGLLPISTFAQTSQSPQSTTAPAVSRFEIVQSELAARWTFRLDKQCGTVAQLVSGERDGVAWQKMLIIGLADCANAGGARFQIFTSGLAARHTFLINTQTGQSWVLVQTGETAYWAPFEE